MREPAPSEAKTPLTRRAAARLPEAMAIALGLAAADPAYAGRIRAAQIAAIVRMTPFAMVASCLNASILLGTLTAFGGFRPLLVPWCGAVFAMTAYYFARPRRDRGPQAAMQASERALRAAVRHGALAGAVWGAVPMIAFAGSGGPEQLLVGCLTAGMIGGGGFALASVPMAACAYIAAIAAGSVCALLSDGAMPHIGLTALLLVYAAMITVNVCWNAQLFVERILAEARLRDEVAAREQAQAQASHAQRMTALGELAGGVAHDFDNVLQAIAANAGLLAGRSGEPAQVERVARAIAEAAERGGSISRRMLAFARQDSLRPEAVDAAALLADAGELLRHSLGPSIMLRIELPPETLRVRADRPQLETVLVNLARNARDAMPQGGALTLSAAAEAEEPDAGGARPQGRHVRLSVSDTGTGMDAELLARATEPFFTTKPRGKGTGLGLSMAKAFAEQSGGALRIESAPGRGTTVSMRLPAADQAGGPASDEHAASASSAALHGVRVLLVDDDDLVRQAMASALREAGCEVVEAEDARGALQRIDSGAGPDVLVTDFTMPGLDGCDLIRAARQRRPGLPAILLTGHVDLDGGAAEDAAVMLKPVRLTELTRRLAQVAEDARLPAAGRAAALTPG